MSDSRDLRAEFNQAVDHFWSTYQALGGRDQCFGVHKRLSDATDDVLLARDALIAEQLDAKAWDEIVRDVVDVTERASQNGIRFRDRPVMNAAGRMTYTMF